MSRSGARSQGARVNSSSVSFCCYVVFQFKKKRTLLFGDIQCDQVDPFIYCVPDNVGHTVTDIFLGVSVCVVFILEFRTSRRRRPGCVRKATPEEIYIHGRWKLKNSGREIIDLHYLEPTLEDKVYLTLLCF